MKAREYKGPDELAQAMVGAWQEKECFTYGALRDPIPLDWMAICLLFIDWLGWGDRDFESRDELVKVVVYGSYLFHFCSKTTIETVKTTIDDAYWQTPAQDLRSFICPSVQLHGRSTDDADTKGRLPSYPGWLSITTRETGFSPDWEGPLVPVFPTGTKFPGLKVHTFSPGSGNWD